MLWFLTGLTHNEQQDLTADTSALKQLFGQRTSTAKACVNVPGPTGCHWPSPAAREAVRDCYGAIRRAPVLIIGASMHWPCSGLCTGSCWFCSLDLRSRYQQVDLVLETRSKPAFTTGPGLWLVPSDACQGLCRSAAASGPLLLVAGGAPLGPWGTAYIAAMPAQP